MWIDQGEKRACAWRGVSLFEVLEVLSLLLPELDGQLLQLHGQGCHKQQMDTKLWV